MLTHCSRTSKFFDLTANVQSHVLINKSNTQTGAPGSSRDCAAIAIVAAPAAVAAAVAGSAPKNDF